MIGMLHPARCIPILMDDPFLFNYQCTMLQGSVALVSHRKNDWPTINTQQYGGFEQVGDIGSSLPQNDSNITTQAGDIVLYSGNSISIFYDSNTWSYTRLGKITGKTQVELKELLGKDRVTVSITRAENKEKNHGCL